jgi:hypothetical protein
MAVPERNLVAMGELERLRHSDSSTPRPKITSAGQSSDRRSLDGAFVSGMDPRRDLTVDVFTLSPASQDCDPATGPRCGSSQARRRS